MKQAQSILNDMGYEAGPADGKAGAKTREAIKAFQSDRGIPVNGRLDSTTQAELIRE